MRDITQKKKLILFEKAKESKILLNGVLSTVIMFLMLFIGQVVGRIFISIIVGVKHGADNAADHLMKFTVGPVDLALTFIG